MQRFSLPMHQVLCHVLGSGLDLSAGMAAALMKRTNKRVVAMLEGTDVSDIIETANYFKISYFLCINMIKQPFHGWFWN